MDRKKGGGEGGERAKGIAGKKDNTFESHSKTKMRFQTWKTKMFVASLLLSSFSISHKQRTIYHRSQRNKRRRGR